MNYREILEDFVNNENTDYCYDWQSFDYETILPCIEQLLYNEDNLQSKIDKAIEYINKHCVNEKISKEVGYKCYTMADTNELEKIMNILGDDK